MPEKWDDKNQQKKKILVKKYLHGNKFTSMDFTCESIPGDLTGF